MKGIKYIAPLFDSSGYAQASRGYALALYKLGVPITIHPISFEEIIPDLGEDGVILRKLVDKKIDYDVVVIHSTPEFWERYKELGKLNVGYTVWETSKLHPSWPRYINNNVDVCFVGCDWNVGVFKDSGVTVPLYVVPHVIDVTSFENTKLFSVSGIKKDAYKFYNIFQFTERKHPMALIKSYWAAFQNNENVALILKTYRSNFNDEEKNAIKTTLERLKAVTPMDVYPPIYLITSMLSRDEVLGLHKYGDCLVSLDRGEGFGLCVSANTSILVENGTKCVKEITKGDIVMGVGGKFHEVSNVYSRYVGDALKINVELHEDIVISKEHPFYVVSNISKWKRYNYSKDVFEKNLAWVKAEDIVVGDYVAFPKPVLNANVLGSTFDISKFVSLDNVINDGHSLYLVGDFSTKNLSMSYEDLVDKYGYTKKIFESAIVHLKNNTAPSKGSITNKAFNILLSMGYGTKKLNKVTKKVKITDELLNLFGWYLAKGSINDCTFLEMNFHRNEYNVACGLGKVFEKAFKINEEFVFLQEYENKHRLIIRNKIIASLFSNLFGKDAVNKHIPKWLFFAGHELKPLLKGLFDGSGRNYSTQYILTTTSSSLAYQVKSVCNALNYCPSFKKHLPSVAGNYCQYSVSITNKDYENFTGIKLDITKKEYFIETPNFFLVKVCGVEPIKYNGMMYDISVQEGKSFVGNGLLLHNCPFEAGAAGNPIMVTGFGGVRTYADKDNSYLVKYTLTPVSGMPWSPWYRGNQMWAEPDCGHAIELFQHIYNNKSEAEKRGQLLRTKIISEFTWKVVGEKMLAILNKVCG